MSEKLEARLAQLIENCHAGELATTAKEAFLEARINALEDILARLIASSSSPPFPAETLRSEIHEATARRVHEILGGYSDLNPSIAAMVKSFLDQTRFGPFPLPDVEEP